MINIILITSLLSYTYGVPETTKGGTATETQDCGPICCNGFYKDNKCDALEMGLCTTAEMEVVPDSCIASVYDCPTDGTTDIVSVNRDLCCAPLNCCQKTCENGEVFTGELIEKPSGGILSEHCVYKKELGTGGDGGMQYEEFIPCEETATTAAPECAEDSCCYFTCDNTRQIRGSFDSVQGICDLTEAQSSCDSCDITEEDCCNIICDDGTELIGDGLAGYCQYELDICGCAMDDTFACSNTKTINRRDNCNFELDDCCDETYECPAGTPWAGVIIEAYGEEVQCVTTPCYPVCNIDRNECCTDACEEGGVAIGTLVETPTVGCEWDVICEPKEPGTTQASGTTQGPGTTQAPGTTKGEKRPPSDETSTTDEGLTSTIEEEEGCFFADSDFEWVEEIGCQFCFHRRRKCRKVVRKVLDDGEYDEIDFTDGGWGTVDVDVANELVDVLENEAQCFLDYCIEQVGDESVLPQDCTIDRVRLKKKAFSEENCACELIICQEARVNGGGVEKVGIFVVFGFMMAVFGFM